MIQEKDFLYRVPVKNVLVTTPRQQVRNPEILVDLEGGEFMHGNILDANSTNKLINQSVKDAVDNKLIESGYVTKGLLEAETTRATEQENSLKTLIGAETSARTKGDEDLSSKIKAEQTRAEGKEKEISDKLAIVNGDSNTEGSFRKAIADVVAAAPEDLDTLKEIADKLTGNDDLHTALNQAITEKADASALANEVSRATGAESGLQAAIATKADATALSNYVLTTALNQQVDTLNTAISAKQDAGNYIPYEPYGDFYEIPRGIAMQGNDGFDKNKMCIYSQRVQIDSFSVGDVNNEYGINTTMTAGCVHLKQENICETIINTESFQGRDSIGGIIFELNKDGVQLKDGDNNHVLTSNSSTIDITQYAKKSELPTVPTKISQLTNDSNFITADYGYDEDGYFLRDRLNFGLKNNGVLTIGGDGITSDVGEGFSLNSNGLVFNGKDDDQIPTATGDFISISNYATRNFVTAGLSAKQNKITVNTVDITDIETADVTKLRTIVTNLINALSSSGLISATDGVE